MSESEKAKQDELNEKLLKCFDEGTPLAVVANRLKRFSKVISLIAEVPGNEHLVTPKL